MNLLSMTDYVLQDESMSGINITNYAKFLKQANEKWMFVPCDEDGNVLETPSDDILYRAQFHNLAMHELMQYKQYKKAKERCLFNNFEIIEYNRYNEYLSNGINSVYLKQFSGLKHETIEYLVKYNIQLTPTALKQIGLTGN